MGPVLRGIGIFNKFIEVDELSSFCYKRLVNKDIPLWEQKILRFLLDFMGTADFILQKSSGTTGIPKDYLMPKKSMIMAASRTLKMLDLHEGQSAMLCLPVDYIAGKMVIVRALVAGMNLNWTEPTSHPDLSGFKTIDFCAMVPLQVYNLLENRKGLSNIKTLLIGGSEISDALEKRLILLPGQIYETFGMAETCSHIALRRINGPKADYCFNALQDVKISKDNRSCLVIEAPYLSDRIVTNDVVEIVGPGRFFWKGRYDNLINSGGIKINPEELEKRVFEILGRESCMVGIPDDKLGLRIVMVTCQPFSTEEAEPALAKLRSHLPPYHIPSSILTIGLFPRNKSFKIDRIKLTSWVLKTIAENEKS